ncbi:MAG: acyl carrier protein phosphodiesterase [Salibacter sp.]|uniref:acyl carrier protein phosphodiesterase n=1 Tax=Salibacter sp. TaxID=2010995 RepID=UPI00286FD555|nr:acyl carrier protein phosphodiesterase [Salibacter sp.]MDR9399556.1 acyl carrier protein phosphodiesterase [Salibacter sp.]
MNFLAHLLLSGNDEKLTIGNYLGDFVRSVHLKELNPQIVKGVELHHAIDSYTDAHLVFQKSVERLRPSYRKYSPVLTDIFYDYFLARNWSEFSNQPLQEFAFKMYELLNRYESVFPPKAIRFLQFLERYNVLYNYGNKEGIQRVLNGMSKRASFNSKMDEAVEELKEFEADFNAEFMAFFPDLLHFCEKWIADHE